MKKTIVIITVCITAMTIGCNAVRKGHVQPLHPEKWSEIEAFIRTNWLADVETNPHMPIPYTRALEHGILFYWDFYFHNEGLMRLGYDTVARNNIECKIYQINKFGFIPNMTPTGEDRSQPPFFAAGVQSYWEHVKSSGDTAWLRRAYNALVVEYHFWTDDKRLEDHSTSVDGLQRFAHHRTKERLEGFYNYVFGSRFHKSNLDLELVPSDEKVATASHFLAEAATGMDFTPRFEGRCMDYVAIELNSLLYGYEKAFASFERTLNISDGREWERKAGRRAELIDKYCWNEERGLYLDYDFVNGRQSPVASIAGWFPLFVGMASKEKAKRVRDNLPLFLCEGGVATCEVSEQEINYQWGHNSVWGPMQQIAIESMRRYGFRREAKEISLHWLNTVTRNFVKPNPDSPSYLHKDGKRRYGYLYEKYTREGNINDIEYRCSEILGWTASSFLIALETVRYSAHQRTG